MRDLEFYPTDDLFDEPGKRFEHVVVVGKRKSTKNETSVDSKYYAGDQLVCLGLLELVKEFLLTEFCKDRKTIDAKEV